MDKVDKVDKIDKVDKVDKDKVDEVDKVDMGHRWGTAPRSEGISIFHCATPRGLICWVTVGAELIFGGTSGTGGRVNFLEKKAKCSVNSTPNDLISVQA